MEELHPDRKAYYDLLDDITKICNMSDEGYDVSDRVDEVEKRFLKLMRKIDEEDCGVDLDMLLSLVKRMKSSPKPQTTEEKVVVQQVPTQSKTEIDENLILQALQKLKKSSEHAPEVNKSLRYEFLYLAVFICFCSILVYSQLGQPTKKPTW